MRAVTFSTPEVQDLINQYFTAVTTNIEGSKLAGESISHSPNDQPGNCIRGNGRQNVQTIFLTPDLKVLHAVTGFVSPQELVEEIKFVGDLWSALKDKDSDPKTIVQQNHQQRLRGLSKAPRVARGNQWKGSISDSPAFDQFRQKSIRDDHQFSIRNPLAEAKSLDEDPGDLVGRGQTYFSSSSNSSSNRSDR